MARSLWRDKRTGAPKVGDLTQQASKFRAELKADDFAAELIQDVRRSFEQRQVEHNADRDTDHLHASDLSKRDWCPRSSWYRITGVPEDSQQRKINPAVAIEGNDIHDAIQDALYRTGRLTGEWKCLVCWHIWYATSPKTCPACIAANPDADHDLFKYWEVPIEDESIRLIGRGDGLVEDTRVGQVLVEVKSVGLGTVRLEVPGVYRDYEAGTMTLNQLWDAIVRPFPSHLKQMMLYLRARKLKYGVAIYQNKWDQRFKGFQVRYQPHIIEDIVVQAETVVKALDKGTSVPRPEWAEDENTRACKECPYRRTCWRIDGHDEEDGQTVSVGEAEGRRVFQRR